MSFRIVIELWHILYMVNIDSSYENNCLFSPGFDAVYEIWKVVCVTVFLKSILLKNKVLQASSIKGVYIFLLCNTVPQSHWLIISQFHRFQIWV
jgi:hypothetical protein